MVKKIKISSSFKSNLFKFIMILSSTVVLFISDATGDTVAKRN